MAEYVEREAVLRLALDGYIVGNRNYASVCKYIRGISAADVRPLVKAHWEWDENGMDWGLGAWKCSCCKENPATFWNCMKGNPMRFSGSRFCGNCGAMMEADNVR